MQNSMKKYFDNGEMYFIKPQRQVLIEFRFIVNTWPKLIIFSKNTIQL